MELNHNFAWHQSIIRELRFFCLVMSVGQRKSSEFPMRNRTSDLRIPCSDALPLSFWDSTVSRVYYEVQKTRLHHTAGITKYSIYKLIIVWDFLDMDQCVVFLGKSLYSQSVSLYFGV